MVAYVATKPYRPVVAKYAIGPLFLFWDAGIPGIFATFYVSMIRGGSPAL